MNSSDPSKRYRAAERYRTVERFIASREFFGMKLGLDNVQEFASSIGSPQESFPAIHVAGTNGKGSTVMMLGSVLRKAGYKTGVFTSPHLVDFRERIRVDGKMIEREFVTRWIENHKSEIKARQITYFEVMVAMALSYFKARKVEIAVIETGLGGRLDATNILSPILSVITEISLDHTSILGDTLSKIATEKAGIIKTQTPLVIATMQEKARRKLESVAKQRKAPLVELPPVRVAKNQLERLSLAGEHQQDNARNVLAAVKSLNKQGYTISDQALKSGLSSVRWAGRFQILRADNGAQIILDVAHNDTGLQALVKAFQTRFPGKKARAVVGFVRNKDHRALFEPLVEIASEFHLTRLPTRRGVNPKEFKTYLQRFSGKITLSQQPKTAFSRALRNPLRGEPILIVGSHYLVGEFLRTRPHRSS